MNFCVATIDFWNSVGFNTDKWRKSEDGLKALCHSKFAKVLIEDIEDNENIEKYNIDSIEFKNLIANEFSKEKP